MVTPALQALCALSSDCIDLHIIDVPVCPGNELDDVGIVAACKSSVRGNDNHCLLGRFACCQIWMIDVSASGKHGLNRLVHVVEIRIGLFCAGLCLLQLDGRNKLHCFGDLLCAGNTLFSSLNVSH